MASKEIATNTNTMSNDIEELRAILDKSKKLMDNVMGQMAELDAMWDGAANEAFNLQIRNDQAFANEVFEAINDFIDCMNYAKNEYNKCENEVSEIIGTIRI